MDWEIQKRSDACHVCEREFRDGNVYHCTLRFEQDVPVRRDTCDFCWKGPCYVLALMLERKKDLVQREQADDKQSEKKLIVYEHSKTGDTFIIEDPQLSLSEIGTVQEQVSSILEMEQVEIGRE